MQLFKYVKVTYWIPTLTSHLCLCRPMWDFRRWHRGEMWMGHSVSSTFITSSYRHSQTMKTHGWLIRWVGGKGRCILFNSVFMHSENKLYRRLFGDGSDNSAGPSKRIILTKKTAYQLMIKQKQQEDEGVEGQTSEACVV